MTRAILEGNKTVNLPPVEFIFARPRAARPNRNIDADDRANHCFIHAAALRRLGLGSLARGQRIRFRIAPPKRNG
jgi:hypothetical protein